MRERGLRAVSASSTNVRILVFLTFSDRDVKQFIQWTDNAFQVFSDKYRNIDGLEIGFVDDMTFQNVFKKIGRATEEQKSAAGITNPDGTSSFFKLKIGLSVLNSTGDGAIKALEDVIVHEMR